jgi:hypothetical protein
VPSNGTDVLPERSPDRRAGAVVAVRVVGTSLELDVPSPTGPLWIGSDPTCDLYLPSRFVSMRHATLERVGGTVVVRDRGSTNGVRLGEMRVPELELAPQQEFRIGDQTLVAVSAELRAARRRVETWLGHADRFQPAIDEALAAATARRHAIIAMGATAATRRGRALAHLLHDAAAGPARPRIDATGPLELEALRAQMASARGGSLVLAAADLPEDETSLRALLGIPASDVRLLVLASRDRVARACSLVPGAVVIDVPDLAARTDDLLRLIVEVAADVARRRRWSADLGNDLGPLLAYAWPGNLDELDETVERVLAVRALGSLRAAEDVLGVSKSALGRTLKRVGLEGRR